MVKRWMWCLRYLFAKKHNIKNAFTIEETVAFQNLINAFEDACYISKSIDILNRKDNNAKT